MGIPIESGYRSGERFSSRRPERVFLPTSVYVVLLLVLCQQKLIQAATGLDFENLASGAVLTNQYAGVLFSNGIILTAGSTLNELECPPHSGVSVASDDGGPMTISFASPLRSVSGYFTYRVPLTMQAFDSSNSPMASAVSAFSNNQILSGVSGSQPGELLKISSSAAIRKIVITGDAGGASFTVDDLATISSCDVNADGNTNVTDVQALINQALGVVTATDDLTGDGLVNVVDVQIVINAALGLGCAAH